MLLPVVPSEPVLLAWAVFALSTLSPGPSTLATLSAAAAEGRRAGLLVGLGVTLGSLSWGLAAATGVTALIIALPGSLPALQMVGAAWLGVLALRAGRDALRSGDDAAPRRGVGHPLLRGYLIHLVNPNAMLGWAAIVLVGLDGAAPASQAAAILAGAAVFALSFYGACALLASTPRLSRGYLAARRPIDATLALLFGVAAMHLARAALGGTP